MNSGADRSLVRQALQHRVVQSMLALRALGAVEPTRVRRAAQI